MSTLEKTASENKKSLIASKLNMKVKIDVIELLKIDLHALLIKSNSIFTVYNFIETCKEDTTKINKI